MTPYINYRANYDDNIFRLHDSAAALILLGTDKMSDTVQTATAGIKVDTLFSQQHLTADVSVNRSKYTEFTQFDNTGKDARAALNWHVEKHIEGNIGVTYSQTLTPFTDYLSLTPNAVVQQDNIRIQKRSYFDASWLFHPSWRVRSAYSQYDQNYDLVSQQINNGKLTTTELGLDYLVSTNSTIGIELHKLRGSYPFAQVIGPTQTSPAISIDNSYDQNEFRGKISWQVSVKSQLTFIGGWVKRKYDSFTQRDSSAVNARLIGNWNATEKLFLSLNAWREIGELDYFSANFGLNRGFSVNSTWDVTSKVRVAGTLNFQRREYKGVTALAGTSTSSHNDRYANQIISLMYVPTAHLTLGTSITHYHLDSTVSQLSYKGNGILLNARYEF